ncbi:MAG: VCBS repeat-containing protein [Bacteroidota bacterium]
MSACMTQFVLPWEPSAALSASILLHNAAGLAVAGRAFNTKHIFRSHAMENRNRIFGGSVCPVLCALVLLLLTATAGAQNFREVDDYGWSRGVDWAAPAIADIDGNGLLDMIIGTNQDGIMRWEQVQPNSKSFRRVTRRFLTPDGVDKCAPFFIDLDGNGKLDMLIAGSSSIYRYEQTVAGSSEFTYSVAQIAGVSFGAIPRLWAGDLDDDGILDLLVGESLQIMGHLTQKSPNSNEFIKKRDIVFSHPVPYYNQPLVMDIDGDSRKEMLVGGQEKKILLYRQDAAVKDSFVLLNANWSGISDAENGSPTIVDVDGDGLWDLYVGIKSGLVRHYRQPSPGAIDGWELQQGNILNTWDFGIISASLVCDLDRDGRLDILRSEVPIEVGGLPRAIQHFRQRSVGSLEVEFLGTFNGIQAGIYDRLAITDIGGDGLLDFFITRVNQGMEWYRQKPAEPFVFERITENLLPSVTWPQPYSPSFVDLDLNGKMDLLLAKTYKSREIDRYEEDAPGSGTFQLITAKWLDQVVSYPSLFFIDYDKDGLLDLLLGAFDGTIRHLEQDAPASALFSEAGAAFAKVVVGSQAQPMIFDVNNDGRLDVIVGDGAGGLSLFLDMGPDAVETQFVLPSGIRILGASPQPFTDAATLRVELAVPAAITLRVLDLLGREVARPLQAAEYSAGVHAFQVNLGGLASGIYQAVVCTPQTQAVTMLIKR